MGEMGDKKSGKALLAVLLAITLALSQAPVGGWGQQSVNAQEGSPSVSGNSISDGDSAAWKVSTVNENGEFTADAEFMIAYVEDEAQIFGLIGENRVYHLPDVLSHNGRDYHKLRVISGAVQDKVQALVISEATEMTQILIEEGNGDPEIINNSQTPVEALSGSVYVKWEFKEGLEEGGINQPETIRFTEPQDQLVMNGARYFKAGQDFILTPQKGYTIALDKSQGMPAGHWNVEFMTNGARKIKVPVVSVKDFTYAVTSLEEAAEGTDKAYMIYERKKDGTLGMCTDPNGVYSGNVVIAPAAGYQLCLEEDAGENTFWVDRLELTQDGVNIPVSFRMVFTAAAGQEALWGKELKGAFTYTKDAIPPVIAAVEKDLGETQWTQDTVTLTIICSDTIMGVDGDDGYSFDGGITWQGNSKVFRENTELLAGTIRARDIVGNVTVYDKPVSIRGIDRDAPVITWTIEPVQEGAQSGRRWVVHVEDASLKEVRLYKGETAEGSYQLLQVEEDHTFRLPVGEAVGAYTVVAWDQAGNSAQSTRTTDVLYNDLTVTTLPVHGTYGEDLPVSIWMENTADKSITIQSVSMENTEAGIFRLEPVEPFTLPKGQKDNRINLTFLKGGSVGTYQAAFTITYLSKDGKILQEKADAKVTVTGRELMPQITVMPKTYDGSADAEIAFLSVDGVIPEDDLTVNAAGVYSSAGAGSHKTVTVTFSLSGGSASNYKVPKQQIVRECSIARAQGTGTVFLSDRYVGETEGSIKAQSSTNGIADVRFYYKQKGQSDDEYTSRFPDEEGSYIIKAVFGRTRNYEETEAFHEFTLTYCPSSADMLRISGKTGPLGWYCSDVMIEGQNGWSVSFYQKGEYRESLLLSDPAENKIYMKNNATGALTKELPLDFIQIDKTAPEIGAKEGIRIGNSTWDSFLGFISFGIYKADTQKVTISAHDPQSGIASVSYLISDHALTAKEVISSDGFREGAELEIGSGQYGRYVIYAKIENGSGLTRYLSSDGMIIDKNPPVFVGLSETLTEGAVLSGSLHANVWDEEIRELLLYNGNDTEGSFVVPKIDKDGNFTIEQQETEQQYTLAATDMAGNRTLLHFTIEGRRKESANINDQGSGDMVRKDDFVGEALDFLKADLSAPVIDGAENGGRYRQKELRITVSDENLQSVTVNGEAQTVVYGSCDIQISGKLRPVEYRIKAVDLAGNETAVKFTLQGKIILITGGRVELEAGQYYQLGPGRWVVSADPTVYEGGSIFCAAQGGTYDFTRQ